MGEPVRHLSVIEGGHSTGHLESPDEQPEQQRTPSKPAGEPKKKSSKPVTAADIAVVETARAALDEKLTSDQLAQFNVENPSLRWMTELVRTPVPVDITSGRLHGYRRAIEQLGGVIKHPTALSLTVEQIARRRRLVEALEEGGRWVPALLTEVISVRSEADVRRYELFTRVGEFMLEQSKVVTLDLDMSPLRDLPELDQAAVVNDPTWLLRLGDQLDLLAETLEVMETGLKLLLDSGE